MNLYVLFFYSSVWIRRSLKSCVNVIHKPYPYSTKFNAVDTDYNDNKRRRANVPHIKTNMGLTRRYIYDEKKDTRQDLDASGMGRFEREGGGWLNWQHSILSIPYLLYTYDYVI